MTTYRIAVATRDGRYVDTHFGSAQAFDIYDVDGAGSWTLAEKRQYEPIGEEAASGGQVPPADCSCGCRGQIPGKVQLLSDCRFLLCAAAGPGAVRMLENAGITTFDVELPVEEALAKITAFYGNAYLRSGGTKRCRQVHAAGQPGSLPGWGG